MVRKTISTLIAAGAVFVASGSRAETWKGCVGVSNLSGVGVKVRLDSYPGWHWDIAASDTEIRYLKHDNDVPLMEADSHNKPPIHIEPQTVPIMWNFFTGESDPEHHCVNAWRIVIVRPMCASVVDNLCR